MKTTFSLILFLNYCHYFAFPGISIAAIWDDYEVEPNNFENNSTGINSYNNFQASSSSSISSSSYTSIAANEEQDLSSSKTVEVSTTADITEQSSQTKPSSPSDIAKHLLNFSLFSHNENGNMQNTSNPNFNASLPQNGGQ